MGDRSVRYIKVCESLALEGSASRRAMWSAIVVVDVDYVCTLYIVCSRTAI
jgi:hypothetical protein